MRQMTIEGIPVNAPEDATYDELKEYVNREKGKYTAIQHIDIEFDGEYVNIKTFTPGPPFERIRRITGYLVGAMPRWNDAKRAEEHDRVKHALEVT